MNAIALIALGSNLGDRRATLLRAIDELDATPGVSVREVSAFHETEPVGGPPGQGPYLNAAACARDDPGAPGAACIGSRRSRPGTAGFAASPLGRADTGP